MDLTYVGDTHVQYLNLSVNGTWQVMNALLPAVWAPGIPQTLTFNFQIGTTNGAPVNSVQYDYSLTPFLLATMPLGSASSNSMIATVTNRLVELPAGILPGTNCYRPAQMFVGVSNSVVTVSNFTGGVSNFTISTNFPNQHCGTNECVPAAESNSLLAMINSHTNLLITTNDVTIAAMKIACDWTPDGCYNGWWYSKAQAFAGKLDTSTTYVTAAAKAACDQGCAVVMQVSGHAVSVVAISPPGPDGNCTIVIVEDLAQGEGGGDLVTEEATLNPRTGVITYDPPWPTVNGQDLLQYFIIECPD